MPDTLRPYRLTSALLALVLVLTGTGPLLTHLCTGGGPHAAMTEAPMMDQAHPCCGDHCPGHPDTSSEEAPADDDCCTIAPAAPAESVAVAAPVAPRVDRALFAVVTTRSAATAKAPPVRPALADTGGPPLPVRSHLALSILLI